MRAWVSSLPQSLGREELDELDSSVVKLKQLLRRYQHSCGKCKLGCFESFLHEHLSQGIQDAAILVSKHIPVGTSVL